MNLFVLPLAGETLAFALGVALGGIGVSLLVLAVARVIRRRPEPWRYTVLLTGVAGLLAVPGLVGLGVGLRDALPSFAAPPEPEIVRVPAARLPELFEDESAEPAADPPVEAGPTVGALLVAVWVLGMAIGLGRLLVGLWKQGRTPPGSPWTAPFWTAERRAALARQLGLKRFPPIIASPAAPLPMVIGTCRPTIVVPDPAPAAWDQAQWEAVLVHEAAHIARGDPWAVLAERAAVVLFWWCPLVHLLARRLDALRESICDDWVVQGSCDAVSYAALLVDSAEHFLRLRSLSLRLGLLDSARGGLEARVTRLLAREKPTMTRLTLTGKLLGAACLTAACLMTTAGTAFSGGQAPAAKKVQIKIVIDGIDIDLSDPRLMQLIQAAQQEAQVRAAAAAALKAGGQAPAAPAKGSAPAAPPAKPAKVFVGRVTQTAKPPVPMKSATLTSDDKLLVTGDGKVLRLWDAQSGKIVLQLDNSASLSDPRVEALVKQAEAIKPGSGEAVRRALQPAVNARIVTQYANQPRQALRDQAPGKENNAPFNLGLHERKVLVLDEAGLKALLEKARQLTPPARADVPATAHEFFNDFGKNEAATKAALEWMRRHQEKHGGKDFGTPAPAQRDLESLNRQIERLNAEVNSLREELRKSLGQRKN